MDKEGNAQKALMESISNAEEEAGKKDQDPQEPAEDQKDYIGPDGLLYCGICHTRKQVRLKMPEALYGSGVEHVFPCLCKHRQEEMKRKKEQDDFKEQMYRIGRLKDASLLDSAYKDATFSSYVQTEQNRKAEQIAQKYCDNFQQMFQKNQGLIFYGPVGTGKSYTAACIANRLMDRMTSVIMTSTVKIIQTMSQFTRREELQEYTKILQSPRLLILDDLGAERGTDFAIEQVYNVVDSRSRSGQPMIVTTNVPLSDMTHTPDIRYKRIYDRILATCYPVEISGRSFRMMLAEKRFDEMKEILE